MYLGDLLWKSGLAFPKLLVLSLFDFIRRAHYSRVRSNVFHVEGSQNPKVINFHRLSNLTNRLGNREPTTIVCIHFQVTDMNPRSNEINMLTDVLGEMIFVACHCEIAFHLVLEDVILGVE